MSDFLGYRKIPKINKPGGLYFSKPFLRGLFLEGLKFGGAYLRKAICVSKLIGLTVGSTWRGLFSEFYGVLQTFARKTEVE